MFFLVEFNFHTDIHQIGFEALNNRIINRVNYKNHKTIKLKTNNNDSSNKFMS
jgi:hypothetical protein